MQWRAPEVRSGFLSGSTYASIRESVLLETVTNTGLCHAVEGKERYVTGLAEDDESLN